MQLAFRISLLLVAFYAGVLLLLAGCQRRLLYHPTKVSEAALRQAASREGLQEWRDARGESIGWVLPNPTARRRLVVFHGNAGHAVHRAFYAHGFAPLDYEVYLFEYPGYGARPGAPSKTAFLQAGRAALDELLAADSRPLALLGESIGSGSACALAAELPDRIAGLVLVVPFARLAEVAKQHLPYLPVGLLLRDKFDNVAALQKYRGSVAFVVAEHDEVVGTAQGIQLHTAYAGSKQLIMLEGAGHNDFPTEPTAEWWRAAAHLLTQPR